MAEVLTRATAAYTQAGLDARFRVPTGARPVLGRLGVLIERGLVALEDLSEALQPRYGVDAGLLIEAHSPTPLRTPADREGGWDWTTTTVRKELEAALAQAHAAGENKTRLERWVTEDARYLREALVAGDGAEQDLRRAMAILAHRPVDPTGPGEALPVLADRAVQDPHAADMEPTNGTARFVLRALWHDASRPCRWRDAFLADNLAAVLSEAGLVRDDISSDVTVVGLDGDDALVRGARAAGLAITIPRHILRRLAGLRSRYPVVFVVENPSVFHGLLTRLEKSAAFEHEKWPTLVCGHGEPTLAVRELLRLLVQSGGVTTVRYSGDLDLPGVGIAHRLRAAVGERVVSLWRMDYPTFAEAHESVDAARWPRPTPGVALPSLQEGIAALGPIYQEQLLDDLWGDVEAEVKGLDAGVSPGTP